MAMTGPSPSLPSLGTNAAAFAAALIDSRERWRDLALIASDLTFETDGSGTFVLLGPDEAFGWTTRSLLGLSAETLLVPASTRSCRKRRCDGIAPGCAGRTERQSAS